MKTKNTPSTNLISILTAILFISFLLFSCNQQTTIDEIGKEQKEKEELMIELTQTCLNIWMSGNLSLVDEVYSPEIISHTAGHDDVVGIENYKKEIVRVHTAFPDITMEIKEIAVEDDFVIYRISVSGTHTGHFLTADGEIPPTGKSFHFFAMELERIVDGKIVEEWRVNNELYLLKQLGFKLTRPENTGQ